jgi:hypothetical protein
MNRRGFRFQVEHHDKTVVGASHGDDSIAAGQERKLNY